LYTLARTKNTKKDLKARWWHGHLYIVGGGGDVLELRLRDNETKIAKDIGGDAIDINDAFECVNMLSKEML
jgi:ESCRT-I complex subunit TSG101